MTSFVRPEVIPQLADAEEVLAAVERRDGVSFSVLIPNERGLERALAMRDRFDEINVFVSASETHNRKNVNRSIEESLAGLERTLATATGAGLRCEGVISISFGCPYEGEVPPERVFGIAERLAAAGCEEIGFGDTTGMANPRQAHEFFAAARERLAGVELTAHFHNTRGQGLANALAALEEGVESFESSFGELGGCPVPPGVDRQHRHRGPGLDAARDGDRDRDRPAAPDRGGARRPGDARPPARRPRAARRAGRVGWERVGCAAMKSDAFRRAAEAKDFSAGAELFSPDVVFRSPAVFKPYEGIEALGIVLAQRGRGLRGLPLRRPGRDRRHRGPRLRGEGRRQRAERRRRPPLRRGRLIREMMVMVRPASGLMALGEEMGRRTDAAAAD